MLGGHTAGSRTGLSPKPDAGRDLGFLFIGVPYIHPMSVIDVIEKFLLDGEFAIQQDFIYIIIQHSYLDETRMYCTKPAWTCNERIRKHDMSGSF